MQLADANAGRQPRLRKRRKAAPLALVAACPPLAVAACPPLNVPEPARHEQAPSQGPPAPSAEVAAALVPSPAPADAAAASGNSSPGGSWPAAHWLAMETRVVGTSLAEFQARFKLGAEIGRGTFGRVYKACGQHGQVAIKVVSMDVLSVQEVHVQAGLTHSNILPLLDSWASPFYTVLVLPLRCTDLHRYVRSLNGKLAMKQARGICVQMSKAVAYMHGKGILHRDLHALNVLLSGPVDTPTDALPQGQLLHVEISDFGKAHPVPADDEVVLPLPYRPPELLLAPGALLRVSAAFQYVYGEPFIAKYKEGVDIWPLACLMEFAVKGRLPFGSDDDGVVVLKRLLGRLGEPPQALVRRNRWGILQGEVGTGFVAANARRGGLSPAAGLEESWARRVFQWSESARPDASDFVHEVEVADPECRHGKNTC